MDFQFTPQQLEVQEMARNFAEKELLPGILERDASGEFPMELYQKFGELGFVGLPYAEEYGGSGMDYLSYVLALEEVSKVDAAFGISYSVSTSLCAGSIMNSEASEELKKKYLPKVLTGASLGSFGLTEPEAGSDVSGAKTVALRDGDEFVLNGMKCFITNGPLSEVVVVFALTDPAKGSKGLSAFIVEKGTPGFTIGHVEDKMGIRTSQVSELIFTDCRVPAANQIVPEGKGFALAMKTLDGGRIGVAAQAMGIAKGAFAEARKYMMQRVQFGKPIAKQQYLAYKMAELATEIEAAQYLLYKAALDKQEGRPYSVSAAMAKLACTNWGMHVSTEAVQMLGGNGYMKDYHVERMMRDAKITQIYEGTNEIQKLVISGSLFR